MQPSTKVIKFEHVLLKIFQNTTGQNAVLHMKFFEGQAPSLGLSEVRQSIPETSPPIMEPTPERSVMDLALS